MKRPVPQRWYLIGGLCFRHYFKSNFTLSIEILHEFAVVLTCHFQQGRTVEEKLSLLNLIIYDIRHIRTNQKDLLYELNIDFKAIIRYYLIKSYHDR